MQKFDQLTGVAAPLPMMNVDTDMIIPKQFLKTIKRTGLGKNLFDEMRYTTDGKENPGLRPQQAAIPPGQDPGRRRQFRLRLVARACALGAAGFRHPLRDRALASPTSSTTTASRTASCRSRCRKEDVDKLMDDAKRGANAIISIDLEKQEIRGPDGGCIKFEIDAFRKHCLLNGLDDIGLTLQKAAKIDSFEAKAKVGQPWLWRTTPRSVTLAVMSAWPGDPRVRSRRFDAHTRVTGLAAAQRSVMTEGRQCTRRPEIRHAHQQETADPRRRRHRPRSDGAR